MDLSPERGVVDRRPRVVVGRTDGDHVVEKELADDHVAVARRHMQLHNDHSAAHAVHFRAARETCTGPH